MRSMPPTLRVRHRSPVRRICPAWPSIVSEDELEWRAIQWRARYCLSLAQMRPALSRRNPRGRAADGRNVRSRRDPRYERAHEKVPLPDADLPAHTLDQPRGVETYA